MQLSPFMAECSLGAGANMAPSVWVPSIAAVGLSMLLLYKSLPARSQPPALPVCNCLSRLCLPQCYACPKACPSVMLAPRHVYCAYSIRGVAAAPLLHQALLQHGAHFHTRTMLRLRRGYVVEVAGTPVCEDVHPAGAAVILSHISCQMCALDVRLGCIRTHCQQGA